MPANSLQKPALWLIRLFGGVEVTTPAGTAIGINSRKTGELLAYLALHAGRAHSREKLVDIIWGDSEVGDARARLRQEILSLRSLIADSDGASSPLDITKNSCGLTPETDVGVIRFEEACLAASREADCLLKFSLYRTAIQLYTADLLPGYESAWITGERARLSQCLSRALLELADVQRQLDDYPGAEETLNIQLKHDPVTEECHIALMRLYAELGQPTRVQQQAQAMVRTLRDSLGVEPTAASLRLAEELRETAGKRAAALSITPARTDSSMPTIDTAASTPDSRLTEHRSPYRGFLPSSTLFSSAKNSNRLSILWPAILVLAAAAGLGVFRWKAIHSARSGASSLQPLVARQKEVSTYIYQPRSLS